VASSVVRRRAHLAVDLQGRCDGLAGRHGVRDCSCTHRPSLSQMAVSVRGAVSVPPRLERCNVTRLRSVNQPQDHCCVCVWWVCGRRC